MAIPTDDRQHQKNSKADSSSTSSKRTQAPQAQSSHSRVQEHGTQLINQEQPGTSGQYEAMQENFLNHNLPQNLTKKPSPKTHFSTSHKLSTNNEILSLGPPEQESINSQVSGLKHHQTQLPKLLIPTPHPPIRFHPHPHSPLSLHHSGSHRFPHHFNFPLPHTRHTHPPPRHRFPPPPHSQTHPPLPRPHLFHHPRPHHRPPGHHNPGAQQNKSGFPTSFNYVRNIFSPKTPTPSTSSSSSSQSPKTLQSLPFAFPSGFKCPLSQ